MKFDAVTWLFCPTEPPLAVTERATVGSYLMGWTEASCGLARQGSPDPNLAQLTALPVLLSPLEWVGVDSNTKFLSSQNMRNGEKLT